MKTFFEKLSTLVEDTIIEIQPLASGFLSEAKKLIGNKSNYIMRECFIGSPGFEYLSDIRESFETSHQMYLNSYPINNIQSYGIIEFDGKLFHVQDFQSGELLNDISVLTEQHIKKIATKIGTIHKEGKDIVKQQIPIDHRKGKYLRSLREPLTHKELVFSIYENHETSEENRELQKFLIELLLQEYFYAIERRDITRLTTLHGDFWQGNFIYDNEEIFFIDFSRIVYGEAGIDIGTFIGNLEIAYLTQKDPKYLKYIQIFYDQYIKISGDETIRDHVNIGRIWTLYLHLSPLLQSFLKRDRLTKEFVVQGMGFGSSRNLNYFKYTFKSAEILSSLIQQ